MRIRWEGGRRKGREEKEERWEMVGGTHECAIAYLTLLYMLINSIDEIFYSLT